jgi:hypothetical protein
MRSPLRFVAVLALLAGCDGMPDGSAADPGQPGGVSAVPETPGGGDVGTFSMNLTVGGGFRFEQVSYDVSGNGFHKADTINVAASSAVSIIVGGVPFGTGYTVKLTTRDVAQKLSPCTGTATFDIPSAALVQVPVHLSCHEVPVVAAPQAAPVPRWAVLIMAGLLLSVGAQAASRRRRT